MPKPKLILRVTLSTLPALVFLLGAALKAIDFDGFLEKALYYRSLDVFWIRVGSISTIFAEMILGTLLLFRVWLRPFTIPACMGILVFFSGLIAWAWHAYGIEDCGCFGGFVETPPWVSLSKNAALLVMLGTLFVLERSPKRGPQDPVSHPALKQRWFGLAALGLLLLWTFITLKPQV